MLRNYLVIAARNLQNSRLCSFLNIIGLSFGIGIGIIVAIYDKKASRMNLPIPFVTNN